MFKKSSFYPPKLNLTFVRFVHALIPSFCELALNGLSVNISEDDLKKISELKDKHLLLLPNHPTEDDPYVFLEISRQLASPMNSVAAREAFDWNGGLRGKAFQALGCYSLIRGAPDRESFMTTKSLLLEGERPLVIFIEGEISNQNDIVIPFEPGVVQLAFKAQEELQAKSESIHLLPVAIKYKYQKGIETQIIKSIKRLEQDTGCKVSDKTSVEELVERIRVIGVKVLAVQERRLGLKPEEGLTLDS
ncbi:MAG: 1-acyl-sn-glycerol-3-phosphate acyltransferase [Candidatus Caenarcaniphilales bacterium]|nr:1-acyl-sn-glycerol-3-phosphate acyltransferase [Candidatus Caenarcaniphilales bacterium]